MTHVVHITTWHPWIDGQSGNFVLQQCAALQTAGIKVGLIFSRVEGLSALKAKRLIRGFPSFVRTPTPVPTLGFKTWAIPGSGFAIGSIHMAALRSRYERYVAIHGRPDILHGHVALGAGVATRRLAALSGIPYVLTEHSSQILLGSLTPAEVAAASEAYGGAREVIAVSNPLADSIRHLRSDARVSVIPNLVPQTVFARRLPAGDGDRVVIVTLGHLQQNKRTSLVVEAIRGLPDGLRRRLELHVVGDGPERNALQDAARLAGVETIFHGYLAHAQAMDVLAQADILAHPSAYETFGVVLAEAAALGIPAIATRCGGPESIITPETGLLVDVDDVNQFRAALFTMINELPNWRRSRDMISRSAFDRFHEANVAKAVIETYR